MKIRLSLDATNVQREKLIFELVEPFIPDFSVEPMETDAEVNDDSEVNELLQVTKRKQQSVGINATSDDSIKIKAKKNKKSKK